MDNNDKVNWFAGGMVVGTVIMMLLIEFGNIGTHKEGYIDAMNGKEMYEMQLDTTIDTTWIKK